MPPSKREELVEAAVRVFSRHGFRACSIDRLLEEADISRMTLYNHFTSKDELIVAALRRRDEALRHQLVRFVESRSDDAMGRLEALFDFQSSCLAEGDAHGCLFVRVAAEFCEDDCAIRRVAAEHKRAVQAYVRQQCEAAGLRDPGELAEQIALLMEGVAVMVSVADCREDRAEAARASAERARDAARVLIAAHAPAG